jgi:hypothetical protein
MVTLSVAPLLFWVSTEKYLIDSIPSSKKLNRIGSAKLTPYISMTLPRTLKVPGDSVIATFLYPLVIRFSINSSRPIISFVWKFNNVDNKRSLDIRFLVTPSVLVTIILGVFSKSASIVATLAKR